MLEIDCIEARVVRIGLNTVFNILRKWNCNQKQVQSLLNLPVNYDSLNFDEMRFSREQQERVSYILNIHAGLGAVFSNPENIYGFMNISNHNSPFNGAKPIDYLITGENAEFEAVIRAIDSLAMPM